MSNGGPDPLGGLAPRYPGEILLSDKPKLDEIYAYYIRDFFDFPFQCNAIRVKIKEELYTNHAEDGLPQFYSQYHEKFVHLLTRVVPGRKVFESKKRRFKHNRANRLHWIKPILQNWNDPRIIYFQFMEEDGSIREYFWYKAKEYLVILEPVSPDYYLVTAFCVDYKNQPYYEAKYRGRCGP